MQTYAFLEHNTSVGRKIRSIFFFALGGLLLLVASNNSATANTILSETADSVSLANSDTTAIHAVQSAMLPLRRTEEPKFFDMLTNLPGDWRDWAVESFQAKNWPYFAAIAASTAVMIVYDNPMWTPLADAYTKNKPFQTASDLFVDMGDGKFQFGLAAAFAGYGFIADDKKALRTASQTVEVILACGGVVQLLKHVTGRESPNRATSPTGVWRFFPNQIDYLHHTPAYDAFPSGHLATATATFTVIANNYPDVKWLKPVGYVCLAGIATGLVSSSIHWWSDFPLALALGYGFGTLISPNPNKDVDVPADPSEPTSSTQLQFYPTYAMGQPGLGMAIKW